MAKGNMILTLVAQTSKWASGLKSAAKQAVTFGSVVRTVGQTVSTAFLGIAGAVLLFLPNFIKMGEEARKSERRLLNIAENTGLFEKNLEGVTKRISTYAEELSFLTGVDDELIRENEAVLLTFKDLAKSADEIGGPFDRAVVALLDLQAAGKQIKAVQLGKALQDPINNMTALRKAGILLTDEQKDLIATYMEANDILGAQDVLLGAIEDQVGGTAAATASATEKMSARFEDLLETLSDALLPAVDTLADKFAEWIESAEGKKAIDELTDSLLEFSNWITSPEGGKALDDMATTLKEMGNFARDLAGFLRDVKKVLDDITKFNTDIFDDIRVWVDTVFPNQNTFNSGNPSAPGGRSARSANKSPVTVNVSGITPSATIGKTIQQAVKDAERLGVR